MLTIPYKKLKSREATMTYLLDPARLKSFILDLRTYLMSTQHLCQKEGFEKDPRNCVHRQLYNRPETVMFRRFGNFCYLRKLNWEAARTMLELMLSERFLCECEIVWRLSDEQLEDILAGRKR